VFEASSSVGHRLLAPRIAYVVGSRGGTGPNMAPISNLTSISWDPQLLVVAVFKEWRTYQNLLKGPGFTVSVPPRHLNDAVWRLGDKYSGFEPHPGRSKLDECGTPIDHTASSFGPVLADGVGWLECRIVQVVDVHGDHGVFVGGVVRAFFNESYMTEDGYYVKNSQPVMQLVGNTFATSTEPWENTHF
jgi:flavin reductase (DIM6/NTAB) family NADH-FMN oxidoreductase RutF